MLVLLTPEFNPDSTKYVLLIEVLGSPENECQSIDALLDLWFGFYAQCGETLCDEKQ